MILLFDEPCGEFVDVIVDRITELAFQHQFISVDSEEHDSGRL